MTVRVIGAGHGSHDRAPMRHVEIDGTEYLLCGGPSSVTIIAGAMWIQSRRTVGRTFWTPASVAAHYRRHGAALEALAREIVLDWRDCHAA